MGLEAKFPNRKDWLVSEMTRAQIWRNLKLINSADGWMEKCPNVSVSHDDRIYRTEICLIENIDMHFWDFLCWCGNGCPGDTNRRSEVCGARQSGMTSLRPIIY